MSLLYIVGGHGPKILSKFHLWDTLTEPPFILCVFSWNLIYFISLKTCVKQHYNIIYFMYGEIWKKWAKFSGAGIMEFGEF